MGSDMIGAGISAIGDLRASFAQNEKKLSTYYAAIDDDRFPVERGYLLDDDDLVRRDVIMQLMCNFHLEVAEIERRHDIDFTSYFATELDDLTAPDGPMEHGFIEVDPQRLVVVGNGKLFVRNLCMVFDRYLRRRPNDRPGFSRTV
jgi:oxygen-independent coproporphyrinogen-3 oxidase